MSLPYNHNREPNILEKIFAVIIGIGAVISLVKWIFDL